MKKIHEWGMRWQMSPQAMNELLSILDPSPASMMPPVTEELTEAGVQQRLRILASTGGGALWRNNAGAATDAGGRIVRYGLGNDSTKLWDDWRSSDLIGITPVTSTAIGQVFGVFTAVEVKKPGWRKPSDKRERAQENFLMNVRALGGIGMFANSTATYREMRLAWPD